MIKNDRQFGIVRSRSERLERLQDDLLERLGRSPADASKLELELRATRAEIRRMRGELGDYQLLKEGKAPIGSARTLEDVSRLLVRARIAAGLTQADLAERLDLKEQQIQRYEATDYESASLSRLIEVGEALDLQLCAEAGSAGASFDATGWLRNLRDDGIDEWFLDRGFGAVDANDPDSVTRTIARLSHVFRRTPEDVMAGRVVDPGFEAVPAAFKRSKRASRPRIAATSAYVDYLVGLILRATPPAATDLPANPVEVHQRLGGLGRPVTFEAAVNFFWASGVPILPLSLSGGFDAALWRRDQRDVVVLNSTRELESLWLFILLHEGGHISDPELAGTRWLETDPGHDPDMAAERERHANEWASATIFGGRSEALFDEVRQKAENRLPMMQRAVRYVARHENVDVGPLALNVAYRLGEEGVDWWGAAMSLQSGDGRPWQTARDALVARLDMSALKPLDADLLARALDLSPSDGIDSGTER
ncbi:MAG: helix-turn-helix domain-containing protein [Actinobacteria bacterium]|nr:helix-turn-helix domain-containing protein [Actinomycetota bacterium]